MRDARKCQTAAGHSRSITVRSNIIPALVNDKPNGVSNYVRTNSMLKDGKHLKIASWLYVQKHID